MYRISSGQICVAGDGIKLETQKADSGIYTPAHKHHVMQGILLEKRRGIAPF
jgi:hypothetical protein